MMQVDDSFLTRIACGVEGSCMTTKDVEGEVYTKSLPQPTHIPVVDLTVG
jgi:hypothetical protein